MPAEADLSPSDRYFLLQFLEAVVLKADVVSYEVFDVIEILVNLVKVVDPGCGLACSPEVA